ERFVLAKAQIEERPARQRVDERLYHPAHARRHPSGQNAQRRFAAPKRFEAKRGEALVIRGARLGSAHDVARLRRLDAPSQSIATIAINADALRPRREPSGLEAARMQRVEQRAGQLGDLLLDHGTKRPRAAPRRNRGPQWRTIAQTS